VTLASANDLLGYLADVVEELERYAITVLPRDDTDEIAVRRDRDGSLVIDLEGRLPMSRRSRGADLDVFERWQPTGRDEWSRAEYAYELRHRDAGYRRAFHRHDEDQFIRAYGVATHEHCEAAMGVEVCGHYYGLPVADAFDGFRRLYSIWVVGEKPDCLALICLG
jgi:hypothetical protein